MSGKSEKIGPLMKVVILLEGGMTPDSMDLIPEPLTFEFIFGLGVEGLTPFECELEGSEPGDVVMMKCRGEDLEDTFGHLDIPLADQQKIETFYLRLSVISVLPSNQREIISAMASNTSCSDDCCGHS